MTDCCKFEKDGTPTKTFGRNQLCGFYVQLSDKLARLKKAHKKLKKASSHKHKCYDSNSNDSTHPEVLGLLVRGYKMLR